MKAFQFARPKLMFGQREIIQFQLSLPPTYDVAYMANITNSIEQLTTDKGQLTIYDLTGRKVKVGVLKELSKGVYIVNGKKVMIHD